MDNKLIYGKNSIDNIVSIEVTDDKIEVFRETPSGVEVSYASNKFWILCDKIPNKESGWVNLKGNLHYKFGKQYSTLSDFLKDRTRLRRHYDIYSIYNSKEAAMVKDGYTYYKNMHPKDVSILSFDIESAGLLGDSFKEVYLISNTFRKNDKIIKRLFSVDEFESEAHMIEEWCSWVRETNPSIMVGHNIYGYDFPYLSACAGKYGMSLDLGRDGSSIKYAKFTSEYRVDGSQTWEYTKANIYGREIIDTMFLSVKFDIGREFPSWGLKPIIQHLGLVRDGRQFYDASLIKKNWTNPVEREKIKKYAEDDSDDALALFDKMIPSYFYMSQSIPKPFQDVINGASGSWLNFIFLRAYLQDMHSIPKASDVDRFEGAISIGVPGIYDNVWKVDVASLYPSIMRHYKICDGDKDPKHYFSEVVEYFTLERLEHKRLAKELKSDYHDAMQGSLKILINSLYGFLGAPGLNFNSPQNAALVTKYGRDILEKSIMWATQKDSSYWSDPDKYNKETNHSKFKIVNCDTDSISISKVSGEQFSKDERAKLLDSLNSEYPDLISWEDDGYYDKVIVFKAKNYVLRDAEKMKVKVKGSAIKDSKKEPALREMLDKLIKDILDNNSSNLGEIYMSYVFEVVNGIKDISRWCVKKTISKAVLENERTNEAKVRDAFNGKTFTEGEKIFIFNDIDGETPAMAKGEIVTTKKGEPKMIPNRILRLKEDFTGSYDKEHYIGRIYDTSCIFDSVIPSSTFPNFSLKRNLKMLGIA